MAHTRLGGFPRPPCHRLEPYAITRALNRTGTYVYKYIHRERDIYIYFICIYINPKSVLVAYFVVGNGGFRI